MWTKLDDGFTEHPKVLRAGPLGLAVHVAGMVYCGRNLTDGYVSENVADRLIGGDEELEDGFETVSGTVPVGAIVARLVKIGLWHNERTVRNCPSCEAHWPPSEPVGFYIHDYLEYNPTREKVLADRAAAKERRENAKRRSAERRANVDETTGEILENVIDPDPLPTRPAPVPDLDPKNQDQEPRAASVAPGVNGKKPHPGRIDAAQENLRARIVLAEPLWESSLSHGGIVKLNKAHGYAVVFEAMQELWMRISDGTLGPITQTPYGYLEGMCRNAVTP